MLRPTDRSYSAKTSPADTQSNSKKKRIGVTSHEARLGRLVRKERINKRWRTRNKERRKNKATEEAENRRSIRSKTSLF